MCLFGVRMFVCLFVRLSVRVVAWLLCCGPVVVVCGCVVVL